MRQESYTCDVCGGIKGAGNRWLMGWVVRGGFALVDWGFAADGVERVYHFCSEACALAEQSHHLRRDRRLEEVRQSEVMQPRVRSAEGKPPAVAEIRMMPVGTFRSL